MHCRLRLSLRVFFSVLTALLLLELPGSRARAQDPRCPDVTVSIGWPQNGAQDLGGKIRLDIRLGTPPAGAGWGSLPNEFKVRWSGPTGSTGEGPAVLLDQKRGYFDWDTSALPDGDYVLEVQASLFLLGDPVPCTYFAQVGLHTKNPCSSRHASSEALHCVCRRDCVRTRSHTSPLSGHQGFTIPVTSWSYHGATYDFALTYASHNLVDPSAPEAPDFARLSERNSRWSHRYAQWIDTYHDGAGQKYAVWHTGSGAIAFRETEPGVFESPEPNLNLYSGGAATSPSFQCGSITRTLTLNYGTFTVVDADRTEYRFNDLPPSGQTHLV
jgi:hypothetical protein